MYSVMFFLSMVTSPHTVFVVLSEQFLLCLNHTLHTGGKFLLGFAVERQIFTDKLLVCGVYIVGPVAGAGNISEHDPIGFQSSLQAAAAVRKTDRPAG